MYDRSVNRSGRSLRGEPHVAVIGAGMGGLAAAIDLARTGFRVTLLERAPEPGGKMRAVATGDDPATLMDAGPTVLTMVDVFEALFADSGVSLADRVALRPASRLARHFWADGSSLDLHADPARTRDAIGDLAGADEARRFDAFRARAEAMRRTLDIPFMRAPKPTLPRLVQAAGPRALARIAPFSTLAGFLGGQFRDKRLRQLFGRYATYCGSSPYEAPATLALIAAVEASGIWTVEGGMRRLAHAMATRARELGATLRFGTAVDRIVIRGCRARGVVLATGEFVAADAVLCNADTDALARGLFGEAARDAAQARSAMARSLSAVTWTMRAVVEGPAPLRHNVVFSADASNEFDDLRRLARAPRSPTVYLCAEDRADGDDLRADNRAEGNDRQRRGPAARGAERILALVNAPASGDDRTRFGKEELDQCEAAMSARLRLNGFRLHRTEGPGLRTGPREWETLFPGTGGALYGTALRGWASSFRRPGSRSAIEGLYLAGGSVHPGPGVPMAVLSGRLAASAIASDVRRSTPRFRTAAISGGTSTRFRPTGRTD